jgi:hypothetical protein
VAALQAVLTTAGGALSAGVGVVLGAMLARRAQDRHWLRDRQLAAYQDLLREYATFVMIMSRAHADRSGWEYDWARWSSALASASLVAPAPVAEEIDRFAAAVGVFLRVAGDGRDPRTAPIDQEEFDRIMRAPGKAQLALVNAIRLSMDRDAGALTRWLGGSLSNQDQPAR